MKPHRRRAARIGQLYSAAGANVPRTYLARQS